MVGKSDLDDLSWRFVAFSPLLIYFLSLYCISVLDVGAGEVDSKMEGIETATGDTALSVATQGAAGGVGPEAPKLQIDNLEKVQYTAGKSLSGFKAGDLVRCEIEAKHITQDNLGIKERRIWGNEPYTDDSDLVAIAVHSGIITPTAEPPKFSVLVMIMRILEGQSVYTSSMRNSLKSRSLTGYEHKGLSMRLEGSAICKTTEDEAKLTHVVLRPVRLERYSIKSHNAFSEARVIFSLSNEPAFKYSLSVVADRSPDAKYWTSVRLQTQSMYAETRDRKRYELSLENHVQGQPATYRFAECLKPRTTSKAVIQEAGVPLPEADCTIVEKGLLWNQIEWGVSSVRIRGNVYKLACLFFLPNSSPVSTGKE
ncbi:hypothetical protein GUITHDRAFT_107755 [Guillardia theta CCMP2712]|uniref:Uncharacterized protein n=1 Tax=Guillardia theta (strain CCMP2712) TaxID=905079 RepID=L1JDF3_GUITC|nr:hypothetical protein GUITHDRAFT_107755 [Guillardia theta CCMP2712]EKX46551.1 hypothetical protein GUITHDRAFT_107755 [Guillardia theta CCMP2712]|eukprot:XP_005833531.1 hypothetical protein GUITHDRAFT_107755 [Guillardia theta CCMP2712]